MSFVAIVLLLWLLCFYFAFFSLLSLFLLSTQFKTQSDARKFERNLSINHMSSKCSQIVNQFLIDRSPNSFSLLSKGNETNVFSFLQQVSIANEEWICSLCSVEESTLNETKIKQFTQLECIVDNVKLIDFEKSHSWLSARKLETRANCKVVFLCVAHRVPKQHMQTFDRRPSLLLHRTLLNAMWLCGPSKKRQENTELVAIVAVPFKLKFVLPFAAVVCSSSVQTSSLYF